MIKGRYFFWIPLFTYLVYLFHIHVGLDNKAFIGTILCYLTVSSVASFVYYMVEVDEYYEYKREFNNKPFLYFAVLPLYLVFNINYIFDKYLTINK